MNLLLRLFLVVFQAFFRPKIGFFNASVVTFRVLPNDLDLNLHMTNSRYLSVMDLGRVDLLIRSGLSKHLLHEKWQAVLGSAHIRFRRSLKPFQKYQLKTQLISMDDKWFYIEQRFESDGQLIAYGLVKAVFVGKKGSIPVRQVIDICKLDHPIPSMKESITLWNQMEESIKSHDNKDSIS